jgi:Periplasmic binding protein
MGDEVIGHVSALQYSAALDTPNDAAFVKAYRAKYGKVPSYYSESNYTTAYLIDEAMKKIGGNWPGTEQFAATLASLKIDAVRGPISFDEFRNPEGREEEDVRLREGRAMEHRDQDLPGGEPVLDLRQGRLRQAAGVRPRLPAVQILRMKSNDRRQNGTVCCPLNVGISAHPAPAATRRLASKRACDHSERSRSKGFQRRVLFAPTKSAQRLAARA